MDTLRTFRMGDSVQLLRSLIYCPDCGEKDQFYASSSATYENNAHVVTGKYTRRLIASGAVAWSCERCNEEYTNSSIVQSFEQRGIINRDIEPDIRFQLDSKLGELFRLLLRLNNKDMVPPPSNISSMAAG